MDRTETLQIKLPRAMDLGDNNIGAREFPLQLFARQNNYYTRLTVTGIRIIPNFAPVQAFVFQNDTEQGRYASHDGILDFTVHVTAEEPATIKLFNLSMDTEVMLTVQMIGGLYNAIQGR